MNVTPPSRTTGNPCIHAMKLPISFAVTSIPLGVPVEPEVKMMYCVCSPRTQRARSASSAGRAGTPSTSAAASRTVTPESSTGSAPCVAWSTGLPSSWATIPRMRASGMAMSTGTNACPARRQPRSAATESADLSQMTQTGSRPSTLPARAAAMREDMPHSSS